MKLKNQKISRNISFNLDELEEFDQIVGYGNRSETISEMIRDFVAQHNQQQELNNHQIVGYGNRSETIKNLTIKNQESKK